MDNASQLNTYMQPESSMKKYVIIGISIIIILLGINIALSFFPRRTQSQTQAVPTQPPLSTGIPEAAVLQPTTMPVVLPSATSVPPTPMPSVTPDAGVVSIMNSRLVDAAEAQKKADDGASAWSADARLYQVEIHSHPNLGNPVNYVYWYYSPSKQMTRTYAVISGELRMENPQAAQLGKTYDTYDRNAAYFPPQKTMSQFLSKVHPNKLKNLTVIVLHLNHFSDHPVSGESGAYTGWIVSVFRSTSTVPEQAEIEISTGTMEGM